LDGLTACRDERTIRRGGLAFGAFMALGNDASAGLGVGRLDATAWSSRRRHSAPPAFSGLFSYGFPTPVARMVTPRLLKRAKFCVFAKSSESLPSSQSTETHKLGSPAQPQPRFLPQPPKHEFQLLRVRAERGAGVKSVTTDPERRIGKTPCPFVSTRRRKGTNDAAIALAPPASGIAALGPPATVKALWGPP
jgi:hypothetical protein